MKIEYPHKLPEQEAKERIRALGEYLINRHGIGVTWNGDKATIRGKYMVVSIEGTVTFQPGVVLFEGKDPGFLWRGKAKDYLTAKLTKYMNPETELAQLPRGA
ncbi:MAG: polyhydroxyalkanoic acid system family protein [Deltaproteobacteria bacterium]|nr:polyhydroxyalkanoic acid system family protein [Deltaproteobacteria bacterium]